METGNCNPVLVDLATEYSKTLEEHSRVKKSILESQQREKDLADLLDAYEKIFESKGVPYEPRSPEDYHPEGEKRMLVGSESVVRKNSGIATEYAERVVAFMDSIYPEARHFRDIYEAMMAQGVVVTGKDPASTLLARFSSDDRLERVSRGTYRAKH